MRRPVLPEVQPDPVADRETRNVRPDRVDEARAVLPGVTSSNDDPAADDEPDRDFQSVGFTPARTIRTRTWPGPGEGTGRSASRMTLDGPFSA